jgi:hypothetical protein
LLPSRPKPASDAADADCPAGLARCEDDNERGNLKMKKLLICTAAIAMIGVSVSRAEAQTEADATVTLTVGELLFVSIDNATLDFAPGQAEFDAGSMGGVSNIVTTKGNVGYALRIAADAANFNYTGDETVAPPKPAGDFRWKTASGASFTPITQVPQQIDVFTPGETDTPMDYEIDLAWDQDLEGVYDLDITYSVVAN